MKCLGRLNYACIIYTAVHTLWFESPGTADCIVKSEFCSQIYLDSLQNIKKKLKIMMHTHSSPEL